MRLLLFPLMITFMPACARNWVNYPPVTCVDGKGVVRAVSTRAVEFNGSDLNGDTVIEVSNHGVRVAATGGINNSISTAEGYRTARYGAGAIAVVSGLGIVSHAAQVAYGSNQAQLATSNAAAAKAGTATAAIKANQAITTQAIRAGAPLLPR